MLLNRLTHETNFIPNSNFVYPIFFHSSNSVKQFDYIVLQIMYKTSSPLTVYLRAFRSAGGNLFFGFVNFKSASWLLTSSR